MRKEMRKETRMQRSMQTERRTALALLVIRERRLGLALAPQAAWSSLHGVQMARLEFPHIMVRRAAQRLDEPLADALALGPAYYGAAATPTPTRWTYGPSQRHAIDRTPALPEGVAPFLRMERMTAQDDALGEPPCLLTTAVYRAELADDPTPHAQATAAILWLPSAALRTVALGLRIEKALRLDGVSATPALGVVLPAAAFLYMPCDYGERLLQRVAAKYGDVALFGDRR